MSEEDDFEQVLPHSLDKYQTSLFGCFADKVELRNGEVIPIDAVGLNLKAFFCPCLLLNLSPIWGTRTLRTLTLT